MFCIKAWRTCIRHCQITVVTGISLVTIQHLVVPEFAAVLLPCGWKEALSDATASTQLCPSWKLDVPPWSWAVVVGNMLWHGSSAKARRSVSSSWHLAMVELATRMVKLNPLMRLPWWMWIWRSQVQILPMWSAFAGSMMSASWWWVLSRCWQMVWLTSFARRIIPVFGPSKAAAQIEASKSFAKDFMRRHKIPTAEYQTFTTGGLDAALKYIDSVSFDVVVKASGLAAGKGVIVPESKEEAKQAVRDCTSAALGIAWNYVELLELVMLCNVSMWSIIQYVYLYMTCNMIHRASALRTGHTSW